MQMLTLTQKAADGEDLPVCVQAATGTPRTQYPPVFTKFPPITHTHPPTHPPCRQPTTPNNWGAFAAPLKQM